MSEGSGYLEELSVTRRNIHRIDPWPTRSLGVRHRILHPSLDSIASELRDFGFQLTYVEIGTVS
jgi:hypothetical protein